MYAEADREHSDWPGHKLLCKRGLMPLLEEAIVPSPTESQDADDTKSSRDATTDGNSKE